MTPIIDGRKMTPPEPLVKTLAALDGLGPEDEVIVILNCYPTPLFSALEQNGFIWEEINRENGELEIHIRCAP